MSYNSPTHLPYSSTPPAPPPKPSSTQGPPLPPPPHHQLEPQELDSSQTPPSHYHHQQGHQPHSSYPQLPPIESNWLPATLKDHTTSDLQTLLSTPPLQHALLENPTTTHPAIPASQAPLRPLIEENISLATNLLELETRVTALRQTTQSRLLSLRALEQSHRAKIAEAEQELRSFSPMGIYQRLSAAGQEQAALVRGMEESWLDEEGTASEREVGEFVRRIREGKKVAVLRREKKERWDEGRVGGWR